MIFFEKNANAYDPVSLCQYFICIFGSLTLPITSVGHPKGSLYLDLCQSIHTYRFVLKEICEVICLNASTYIVEHVESLYYHGNLRYPPKATPPKK